MLNCKNVVLLSIDALRVDHLSHSGYGRDTSPTLDRLAAENANFTNAVSPSSHTREAVASLLTGRYPDEAVDGSYHLDAPTIPSYLTERTPTAGFHSNPFVSRAYGYGDDFDVYSDDVRIGGNKFVVLFQRALDKLRNSHYARASKINDRSLAWIDDADDGFFLWNHYMDVHGPYEAPEEYQLRFRDDPVGPSRAQKLYRRAIRDPDSITEDEHRTLIDLYDAEIRYLDDAIENFVDELRERGHSDTLVIVTADHGEAFGEHGYYEHPRRVSDELLRVPLVLVHPELDATSVSTPTSTLDVAPTVLSALATARSELPGTSLLERLANRERDEDGIVYAQARGEDSESDSVRFGAFSSGGRGELVRSIGSGAITRDCDDGTDETLADALREHSARRISQMSSGAAATDDDEEVNDAVESRLEALGYKE